MNDKVNNTNDYYKAYEKRYSQVYEKNMMWSAPEYTPDVIDFFQTYDITKDNKILELGCGEGRDAIHLLEKGYNLLAVDYSKTVIEMCNKLTDNKYKDNFMQFDLIKDEMNETFDFIYSIAVLHMFVTEEHRNKFLSFVREHLNNNGKCLICILGDGSKESASDINDAFKNTKRTVMNNDTEIEIVTTSCRIVNWQTLENEIKKNNLIIENKWISNKIPEFNSSMCVVVKKGVKEDGFSIAE